MSQDDQEKPGFPNPVNPEPGRRVPGPQEHKTPSKAK